MDNEGRSAEEKTGEKGLSGSNERKISKLRDDSVWDMLE